MASRVIAPKPRANSGGFTKHITLRNGRVIYAADYGLKAFYIGPRAQKPKRQISRRVPKHPAFSLSEAWQSGLMQPIYNRSVGSHLRRKHPIRGSESHRLRTHIF